MKPLYFGKPPKLLFGIYHDSQVTKRNPASCVVLCYPMAHEYGFTHRAFRQLATRLARTGFHALRFDYYGFGDSSGESDESDIDQWIEDISTAIDEAKSLSALSRVSLIGLRLGATATALAAAQRNDVESIVLWEPIIDGAKYIEELCVLHENWMSENLPDNGRSSQSNGNLEIMGTPLSPKMRAGLEKIKLLKLQQHLAPNLMGIENSMRPYKEPFEEALKGLGKNVEYHRIPAPEAWAGGAGMDTVYVPGQTLNLIVSWISKVGG
jgi:pimeloyl-ACP methyl ester carboxylesterase